MTAKKFILLLTLFAVLTAGIQFAVNNFVPVKWEYRTYYLSPREKGQFFGADLKDLGESGWELVSAVPRGENLVCFLKRPALTKTEDDDDDD